MLDKEKGLEGLILIIIIIALAEKGKSESKDTLELVSI